MRGAARILLRAAFPIIWGHKMHLQIPTENAWRRAPRFALTGVWTAPLPMIEQGAPFKSGMARKISGGCGCGCSSRDGLGWLGDTSMTPLAALQQAMQAEGMAGNPDFSNASWVSGGTADVAAGQIPSASFSPACAGMTPAPNLNLLSTASGLSLSAAGATTGILVATQAISATAGAIVGAATMGVGAIIAVIAAIFAHHAQAVKQEQQLGCAAINAFNNAINVIDQAVAAGQLAPADAASSLSTLVTNVGQYVSPSVKHNPCNADCEVMVLVNAIVIYKTAIYQGMTAAAAATAAPSADALTTQAQQLQAQAATATAQGNSTQAAALTQQANTLLAQAAATPAPASSSAIPEWAWLAAAGLAAFLVLR